MKIYIIAGEASGDWYGGKLIEAFQSQSPDVEIRFWGGDNMLSQNANIVKHIRDTAYMGFVEVVKNLRTIKANIALCKSDIADFKPDLIVFIDYPGFNLRIAEWAKANDFKTAYYIAPKVWAWKESRVKKIRAFVDQLYVIFPFEVDYFAGHDVNAKYFGCPLADEITPVNSDQATSIAILPGSRKQELKRHIPLLFDLAKAQPNDKFVLPLAQGFEPSDLDAIQPRPTNVKIVRGVEHSLTSAKYAIVASGTATLETMLYGVPQCVIYIANPISYAIGKQLVKLDYISLVNIIAGKEVVKELLQGEANLDNLKAKINADNQKRNNQMNDYSSLRKQLTSDQSAIDLVVADMLSTFL